jgi:hypothetical protein
LQAEKTKSEFEDFNEALLKHRPTDIVRWQQEYDSWYSHRGWENEDVYQCPFSDAVSRKRFILYILNTCHSCARTTDPTYAEVKLRLAKDEAGRSRGAGDAATQSSDGEHCDSENESNDEDADKDSSGLSFLQLAFDVQEQWYA